MNSKQLTLSSEPKKSYSRSLQRSTDVVIDSENNDQPTNNIDVSCVQTVGLKHAKGIFVLLETNFFTLEAKCIILENVCPIVEKRYWKIFENL
jgi:hypothetical protein